MVKNDRASFKIFCVGDKGSVALSRPMPDLMEFAITHPITPLNFPTGIYFIYSAASIAAQVMERSKDCEKIVLVFNEFKNVISQVQRKVEIMSKK